MTDIVERLRTIAPEGADYLVPDGELATNPVMTINRVMREAADEIERLRANLVSLQTSLDSGPPVPGKKTPNALPPPERNDS